jgi:FkbM family methyltransferase
MKWWKSKKRGLRGEMSATLLKARDLWGINPACVIDVGAASGKWSLCCETIWPDAAYRLVEPLEEDRPILESILSSRPSWTHIQAAAGAVSGEVAFSVSPDLDGSAVYGAECGLQQRVVPLTTLDDIDLPDGDCLLKLDTHGYEVPIFEGASELLKHVTLLVVEVYGQRLTSQSLLFHELCAYLDERGFRTAAVVDIMCRPSDGSFWQADFFFLKKDHPVFQNNSYQLKNP